MKGHLDKQIRETEPAALHFAGLSFAFSEGNAGKWNFIAHFY